MKASDVVCLLVEGFSMTHANGEFLMRQACRILLDGRKSGTFLEEEGSGEIRTEGKRATLGAFTGIQFEADACFDGIEGRVRFILNDATAEKFLRGHRVRWGRGMTLEKFVESLK